MTKPAVNQDAVGLKFQGSKVLEGYTSLEELNQDTNALERLGVIDLAERRPNLAIYEQEQWLPNPQRIAG